MESVWESCYHEILKACFNPFTEYLKLGATIGNKIKTKGTKLKCKNVFQLLRLFFSLGILYK